MVLTKVRISAATAVIWLAGSSKAIAQPCGQEVLLRDSIGIGPASTNGNTRLPAYLQLSQPNNGAAAAMVIQGLKERDVALGELRAIISGANLDFAFQDWAVRVWSSEQAVMAAESFGNLANKVFDDPTAGPTPIGTDRFGSQTFEVVFDLTDATIHIPSGSAVHLALQGVVPAVATGGALGIMESNEEQPPEKVFSNAIPNGWLFTNDPGFMPVHNGRYAYEVSAVIVEALAGDLDADGDVDSSDVELFVGCLAGPDQPNPGCDPAVFARADMDDDGDTDLADFGQLQLHFGETCP